jgi:hypothetical protein
MFNVFIKFNDALNEIKINKECKIEDLKNQIEKKLGIYYENQIIYKEDKILFSGSLIENDIMNEDTLILKENISFERSNINDICGNFLNNLKKLVKEFN